MQEKIDFHSHYFPPAYRALLARHHIDAPDGVKAPEWSAERQQVCMERLSVSFALLSVSSPHLHMGDREEARDTARACNEYGAALAAACPDRYGILASLPLPETEDSILEIRYCREHLGIRGFALLTSCRGVYLGDPRLDPVMEELNREPAVVTIHPTAPPVPAPGAEAVPAPIMDYFFETTRAVTNLLITGAVRKYGNIRFVVPHGGAFLTILSDRLAALGAVLLRDRPLDVAGDLSKLYYDLAGFSMPKQYGLLRQVTDDAHLLYGSDSPFTALPAAVRLAESMESQLPAAMAEKVFRDNPMALLRETGIR